MPQPRAVLRRRQAEPALAGAKEVAAVDEAQQVGHVGQGVALLRQVLLREFAPGAVEQRLERHRLLLQPALQRALGQAQARGHVLAARLAVRQAARDLGADQGAGGGLAQLVELVVEQVFLHLAELGVAGGQRHRQVGGRQQHAVGRGAEAHLAAEGLAVRPVVVGGRIGELDRQRLHLAPDQPAALHQHGEQGVLDALARDRQAAARVLHHHPAAARLGLHREGGGIGDHGHVAREPVHRLAEVDAAGHDVGDGAQLAVGGGQAAVQAQRGPARARHGQLPQHGDLVDRDARVLPQQRLGVEAGVAQQRGHVQALGLEHPQHPLEPCRRAGAQLGLRHAARTACRPARMARVGGS